MKQLNLNILIPTLLISALSIITLLSSSVDLKITEIVAKQIIFVVIGVAVFFLMTKFDYNFFKYRIVIVSIYVATILLLIITLIFGQEVFEAKRWISMFGVQLQPSEIAKVVVIITTAYIFTFREKYKEWALIVASLMAILPIIFLIYIQPHGSMSIICLFLWFITSFVSLKDQGRNIILIVIFSLIFLGIFLFSVTNIPVLLLISLAGVIFAIFAFFAREKWQLPIIIFATLAMILGTSGSLVWNKVLNNYQKNRVIAFLNPESNSKDIAFNVEQSKIAIGSGGILGKGFANGTQSRLNFLPFHQTDFIFASFAESYGLVGSTILLGLYLYLFFYIFKIPLAFPHEEFPMIILVSLGIKMLLEMFVNLGTNLAVIPATGIPLPLMSAGGTITVMTFFSLGLIQGIINTVSTRNLYGSNVDSKRLID